MTQVTPNPVPKPHCLTPVSDRALEPKFKPSDFVQMISLVSPFLSSPTSPAPLSSGLSSPCSLRSNHHPEPGDAFQCTNLTLLLEAPNLPWLPTACETKPRPFDLALAACNLAPPHTQPLSVSSGRKPPCTLGLRHTLRLLSCLAQQ